MHKSGRPSFEHAHDVIDSDTLQSGFMLGTIQVRPDEGWLQSPLGQIHLEPKVMEVLLVLAANAGKVVSRDHLLTRVWRDTIVTEDALARCIYQLRHELAPLLGPGHQGPVIETLRKRGFRLLIPLTIDTPAACANNAPLSLFRRGTAITLALLAAITITVSLWLLLRPAGNSPSRVQSIAVLPFVNMTGDAQYEYLADGFSEQLSHALANIPELRVAARTSAFYFKNRHTEIPDIAEQLNVEALLEGSLRSNGALLRVTVQLVRDDGFHIWSREYDRPLADVLQLQSDIAEQVLMELGVSDISTPTAIRSLPTSNFQAYDRYIRGRHHLHQGQPENYVEAVTLFQQAIDIDPGYALAYSGLADAYSLQISRDLLNADAVSNRVINAIDQALTLDPRLAEAHASRGLHLFVLNQYPEAEPHLRQAVALNTNYVNAYNWLGLDLVYQDRFNEATDAYQQAQRLDPMDASVNRNLGANLLLTGRADEGFSYLQRVRMLQPDNLHTYQLLAGWSVIYGRLHAALDWSDQGLRQAPDDVRLLAHQGTAYAYLGQWQAAGDVLNQARQTDADDNIVLDSLLAVYLASGNLDALDRLLAQLGTPSQPLGVDPPFGKPRVMLRWMMIRALSTGNPQRVIELAEELGTDDSLICSAFGEPGPKLYWARGLQLTGQLQQAQALFDECLDDAQRVIANGGTYPRSLYRLALSQVLTGNIEAAEQQLRRAVSMGWRAYWFAWTDPLWVQFRTQPAFQEIFNNARGMLE